MPLPKQDKNLQASVSLNMLLPLPRISFLSCFFLTTSSFPKCPPPSPPTKKIYCLRSNFHCTLYSKESLAYRLYYFFWCLSSTRSTISKAKTVSCILCPSSLIISSLSCTGSGSLSLLQWYANASSSRFSSACVYMDGSQMWADIRITCRTFKTDGWPPSPESLIH